MYHFKIIFTCKCSKPLCYCFMLLAYEEIRDSEQLNKLHIILELQSVGERNSKPDF